MSLEFASPEKRKKLILVLLCFHPRRAKLKRPPSRLLPSLAWRPKVFWNPTEIFLVVLFIVIPRSRSISNNDKRNNGAQLEILGWQEPLCLRGLGLGDLVVVLLGGCRGAGDLLDERNPRFDGGARGLDRVDELPLGRRRRASDGRDDLFVSRDEPMRNDNRKNKGILTVSSTTTTFLAIRLYDLDGLTGAPGMVTVLMSCC